MPRPTRQSQKMKSWNKSRVRAKVELPFRILKVCSASTALRWSTYASIANGWRCSGRSVSRSRKTASQGSSKITDFGDLSLKYIHPPPLLSCRP